MNGLWKLLKRSIRETDGTEKIEYALVVGLIIIGTIATIASVGPKVLARWQGVDSSVP